MSRAKFRNQVDSCKNLSLFQIVSYHHKTIMVKNVHEEVAEVKNIIQGKTGEEITSEV